MRKHGHRVDRAGRLVGTVWAMNERARRRRREKAAKLSRQKNYRLAKGRS